ncbi:hypothetical protein Q8E16_000287 [Vibrio alginolyticus]|nr:hypothetical protein [Vibrio alginolyticus]
MTNKTKKSNEVPNKISIGVAIPMSASPECTEDHWAEVFAIIQSAFDDDDRYTVKIVSKSNEMAVIQDAIVNNLYHNDIVICDVSCGNPNVMFELGMRLAFDKPTIVIKDHETPYTFDTAPIRHIEYPRSLHYQSILDFKKKLNLAANELVNPKTEKGDKRTFLSNFGNLTAAKVHDKEIPEGQFIIQSLEGLISKIERLERRSLVADMSNSLWSSKGELNFESNWSASESNVMIGIIESVIKEFSRKNKFELPIEISDVPAQTLALMKERSKREIFKTMGAPAPRESFERSFKKAYDLACIPF